MAYVKIKFGYDTLVLVGDVLPDSELGYWLGPVCLSGRIELLLRHGAPEEMIDKINARWHGHVGPVEDFDFSETTAVEIGEEILAAVRC